MVAGQGASRNREVLHRPLGLGRVPGGGGHSDLTHGVVLDSEFGHRLSPFAFTLSSAAGPVWIPGSGAAVVFNLGREPVLGRRNGALCRWFNQVAGPI